MQSYIDILFVLKSVDSKSLILDLNKNFLKKKGAIISIGDLYFLEDYNNIENDPQDIEDAEKAFEELLNWPTGGWIKYEFKNASFLLSYYFEKEFMINGFSISVFSHEYNLQKYFFDSLIQELYEYLKPFRIIKGEDIFNDTKPLEQISKVHRGIFEGTFEIDLRSDL